MCGGWRADHAALQGHAHDELQWTDGILTGWAPAQHDTGCNDVVSMVNKVSDTEAEEVRLMQLSEEQWLCPAC